jgi:hypothetical protein
MECQHSTEFSKYVYKNGCLGCAIRLVASARPGRKQQEYLLGYIQRYWKIDREDVINRLKAVNYNVNSTTTLRISNDNE